MAKAQKGDLIRIVDAQLNGNVYKNGDILTVMDTDDGWGGVDTTLFNGGDFVHVFHSEYEIHRKAGEEDVPGHCDKCTSFVGTENEGSFCSPECIERYQKRIADLADEIREPFRKYQEEQTKQDAVNSPNHYTQGRFETIEIIEEITQGYSDGYVAYCVGNALKYLARAPFKHGEPTEDLAKAGAYINFALERLQTQN